MIRKAVLSEMQICADIIRESFMSVAEKFNITKENAPNYVAFTVTAEKLKQQYWAGREMYVYVYEECIAGFFSLEFCGNNCELNNLCVLPEYRHKRFGKEMLEFSIHTAADSNVEKLTLSIVEENEVLKAWYSSFGFVHTHIKKYDFFPFTCGYMERAL